MKISRYPERILVYEALGFFAILIMILVDEIYEMPKRFFEKYTGQAEAWEGSFEVITIMIVAIVILLMTNRLVSRLFHLEGLLKVCAWCRKIQHEGEWTSIENIFASGFDTQTTHGMCPDCFEKSKRGNLPGIGRRHPGRRARS